MPDRKKKGPLDRAVQAVVATGPDRRITYWNSAAEKLYGWTADETGGLGMTMVRSLVLQVGGDLSVSKGPGAAFTITLPDPATGRQLQHAKVQ